MKIKLNAILLKKQKRVTSLTKKYDVVKVIKSKPVVTHYLIKVKDELIKVPKRFAQIV